MPADFTLGKLSRRKIWPTRLHQILPDCREATARGLISRLMKILSNPGDAMLQDHIRDLMAILHAD
jgi:hypothetical protein